MKKYGKLLMLLATVFMVSVGVIAEPANANSSNQVVLAARRHRRHYRENRSRKHSRHSDRSKIWTGNYRIIGNRRTKIFHVYRGHSYRMNRGNGVFFKSKAAARAAGYRESKR